MKNKVILLILVLSYSCQSQEESFAKNLITSFKKGAINSEEIDWEVFETEVKKSLKTSKITGIEKALKLYGNKHTFYDYKGKILRTEVDSVPKKSTCNSFYRSQSPTFNHNEDGIAYISIPPLNLSLHLSRKELQTTATDYIEKITYEIKRQDKKDALGWVIDLRSNTGGNMWPMLLSLRPFFTQKTLGFFIKKDRAIEWRHTQRDIKSGKNSSTSKYLNKKIDYDLHFKNKKVAVLIGRYTSSSGEATAIALGSVKNMAYFGDNTSGYSTANHTIKMGKDEYLFLTSSVMADYKKNEIWDGIKLDKITCSERELLQNILNWMKE